MQASDLKPGQFFEWNDKRRMTAWTSAVNGVWFCSHGCCAMHWIDSDTEVTPLSVTGWDDEPQPTVEPAQESKGKRVIIELTPNATAEVERLCRVVVLTLTSLLCKMQARAIDDLTKRVKDLEQDGRQ